MSIKLCLVYDNLWLICYYTVQLSFQEYLTLALDTDLEVTSMTTENVEVYWADLDRYVEAMFNFGYM